MGRTVVGVKKMVAGVLVVGIFVCLGLVVYLDYHYIETRPNVPQPQQGRTYPLNVHGTVVYLTQHEDAQLNWLFRGMMVLLVVTAFYNYYLKPFGSERCE
jgi:hypothetical protein